MPERAASTGDITVDKLTIFTVLWAVQSIVHLEFFDSWIIYEPGFGWSLIVLAWATLIWPRRLWPFTMALIVSITFRVYKWPYVANHIFAESVVNFTILAAIAWTLVQSWRKGAKLGLNARNAIFDRFAPVVGTMLVVVYYYAFIAKLNSDFLNPEVSCATTLYGDLVRILPFLPSADSIGVIVIWGTIVVEASIPVLLTFRRTRYFGIILGLGFHFMLGFIGHRTFSAFAFALYSLYCIEPVSAAIAQGLRMVQTRWDIAALRRNVLLIQGLVIIFAAMFAVELTDNYPPATGPLTNLRLNWAFWVVGSSIIALVYGSAIGVAWIGKIKTPTLINVAAPGVLWVMVLPVILSGMSQYAGLKTETSFTMYSNLRTEGNHNNHLFMPALRLADYQDDLVEIIATDHPKLQEYNTRENFITYFEFRRLVSEEPEDFQVTYLRQSTLHKFAIRNGESSDAELAQKHPAWLAKLLYFRPISKGETMSCSH